MKPCQDQQNQSLSTKFIITKEELEEIINDWMKEGCVPVPEDKLRQEEERPQEENPDARKEEENLPKYLDSTESHSNSTPTDPET